MKASGQSILSNWLIANK